MVSQDRRGQSIKNLTLSAADRATLLAAYKSKGESFNRTTPPDHTDLNRQHDVYQGLFAAIGQVNSGADAAKVTQDIDAAHSSGTITDDERDELKAELDRRMAP
jgi:hypothetical protein